MIESFLDQDLYTFTVGQAVLECFPEAEVEFQFTNRKGTKFNATFIEALYDNIERMADLRLKADERRFLEKNCPYLKPAYLDYLSNYSFAPAEVKTNLNDNLLTLSVHGNWARTVFWEVPLLAMISETYFNTVDVRWDDNDQASRITKKSELLAEGEVSFADFGTRRRRNFASQDRVVSIMKDNPYFYGTSNVLLAKQYGVKPIGTMSHQWIMGNSALESMQYANRFALQNWNKVYQGDLGIALTDTYGTDAFLEDFDKQYARLFDGVRQDSGDPFLFADKIVNHYRKLRIDPRTKYIVFSDSLNPELACKLSRYCDELGIRSSFGIGTNFTNDFPGSPALNIVIKLRSIARRFGEHQIQVVKLSDVLEKATGDNDALKVIKYLYYGVPLSL